MIAELHTDCGLGRSHGALYTAGMTWPMKLHNHLAPTTDKILTLAPLPFAKSPAQINILYIFHEVSFGLSISYLSPKCWPARNPGGACPKSAQDVPPASESETLCGKEKNLH